MKVDEIGIFDAKTHFSKVIQKVEQGQVFRVTRRGKCVAEISPAPKEKKSLTKGCAANDAYWMADDFGETPEDFNDYVK